MGEGHLKGHAPEGPEAGGALSPVRGRGGRGTGDEGRHTETGPGSPSLSPAALSSPWPGSGCRGPGRAAGPGCSRPSPPREASAAARPHLAPPQAAPGASPASARAERGGGETGRGRGGGRGDGLRGSPISNG